MKRHFWLFILLLTFFPSVKSAEKDTLMIKETQIPILIDRQDNVLFYLRLDVTNGKVLDRVTLNFGKDVPLKEIKAVKLYYGGTECAQRKGKIFFSPTDYISRDTRGHTHEAFSSYSILKDKSEKPEREVTFQVDQKLFPGVNYFWISLQMKPKASLLTKCTAEITSAIVDRKEVALQPVSPENIVHRLGIGVRHAWDDGAAAYRIPGLATSNKGTLLGVYDVRYNSSVDLQEHIDIGLSRSTDGGQTWEKMRIPLSFGETGGLPNAQNGVGDPAILVDRQTGAIWIVAAWTHGMGNARSWFNSGQGMDLNHTAQLVLTKSEDDGKTWSAPINITEQVKDPSWYFLLQGPGKGITMQDGTLVFPTQYIGADRVPNAGIMYSKDHGKTWNMHHHARTNTTESQVVELEPGVLMLNMRDNRGGSRAVSITKDLGKTWTEHPSSRGALREPVCMASLIKIEAKNNVLGKDILLFSNPDTVKGRSHITIKASLDGGMTWPLDYQLMLDEGEAWGYSCLSPVDNETIGIFYESSAAHMTFQKVKLTDMIR